MSWKLKGTYFENCSCDTVCPCTTSAFAQRGDYERCQVVLAFHVAEGEIDGLDVSGLNLAVVADTPPAMTEGNWKVGVFVDDRASSEQSEALGGVFSGQMGGPMAALTPLIGEMLGMESAPIDYEDDGRSHRVKIGDKVDIEIEDFVPEGGSEVAKLTGMVHPANSTLTIAYAKRSSVSAFGLSWSNVGQNGHSAPFSWAA